ncbi:nif-specific transcriptional activator NifA [Azoarcus sp. KH32C]|uniref:nif-specific transcriptional activator NifA n=1 Tax=Azoarcus sp. KH32C TaxID=748247 RepID=UPI000238666F|nr:nif-specific transcriptional activator NifA [Azoarcus sp. KH32C]BAL26339.1 nif-specific regulatory protein [Azoarcus sp. KH32C]
MSKTPVRNEHLQLVTIYEISKILGEPLELPKMLRKILNVFAIYFETRQGTISLVHESGELHLVGASGMSGDEFRKCRECVGDGLPGRIFKTGMPIVIPDITKEPQFQHCQGCTVELESHGRRVAYIGVPIKTGREVVGVMGIERVIFNPSHRFDEDVNLLKMVANLIGQAVRLHREAGVSEGAPAADPHVVAVPRRRERYSLENVVGNSSSMQKVFAEVHQSAPSRSTILLRGESGTGKEVIARSIHYLSPRRDGPFIKVNCAALSETLLESELFGHEKGAFTGAQFERKGRFELANGGTLFLDEIGEISLAFQAKLLRVLQEREFERVGGNRPIKVDVRLITATNRDLERAVTKGEFRSDLYYRINVVSIFMPPLRERREDIPALVQHFLTRYCSDNDRELDIAPEAMHILKHCYWPGNVRELENCIERTATMTRGGVIRETNIPCHFNRCLTQVLHVLSTEDSCETPVRSSFGTVPIKQVPMEPESAKAPQPSPDLSERDTLLWALEQSRGVQAKAARLLNLSPRQFGYALQKHEIRVKKF